MAWGQNPADVAAAERAAAEARARVEQAPMTPYERQHLQILVGIRDALDAIGAGLTVMHVLNTATGEVTTTNVASARGSAEAQAGDVVNSPSPADPTP